MEVLSAIGFMIIGAIIATVVVCYVVINDCKNCDSYYADKLQEAYDHGYNDGCKKGRENDE